MNFVICGRSNAVRALIFLALAPARALAASPTPGNAPQLPITGARIVNVSTEPQLQTAMGNLQAGDTIVIADGTYTLTSTLYINGKNNVTIRGTSGSANVVLVGQGMDNANFGNTEFGIWSNSSNTTIAHLTIRDTYDNCIILNPGAQSPLIYSVTLINAGSQFVKSNPITNPDGSITGNNNGTLEYSIMEYTGSPPGDHGGNGGGYTNGISAHAAQNWIIRDNLFKNFHTPDTDTYTFNPAVLMWNHSANTIVEQNTFINVDRAVAFGLQELSTGFDHSGGVIRNNFITQTPGLFSPSRTAASDGMIIVWDSPNSLVYQNTVLTNGNTIYAIEFRFPESTAGEARNNLADAGIHVRDSASVTQSGNLLTATPGFFVNPSTGDLHLLSTATAAIDKAPTLAAVTNDFDGDSRPQGAGYDIGADEYTSASSTPTITTASPLPQGTVGAAYTQVLTASGGTAPYTFSVTAGTLPANVTLSSAGVLSGTPSAAGTATFTVQVKDNVNATATKQFQLTVNSTSSTPVLTTITVSPPNATVKSGATQAFSAVGLDQFGNALSPQPAFAWSVSGGGTINVSGLFSAMAGGTFTVTAASGAVSGSASVRVNAPPTITSPPSSGSPVVVVNVPTTFNAGATDPNGGTVTYTWNFGDGTTATGANVPHTFTSVGMFTVTVTISDTSGDMTVATLPITVVSGAAPPIPMTVLKMAGAANFKTSGHDACSISGTLPNLPAGLTTAGQALVLNIGGATATFTLDKRGHGKSAQGMFALKLKLTRDKKTHKSTFAGGNGSFTATLHNGAWAAAWGLDPNSSVSKAPLQMTAAIQFINNTYAQTVTVTCTAKAHVGGKFKK